jgi:hypothetical protein
MQALADELGIKTAETRQRFYTRIKILDLTYMKYLDEKSNQKEKKNG